ncbi:P-loop ATPase, Sll1717 family [Halomonas koreensis]|uniref:P-loop NTPase fold protein n=1 Tax=Halomonas koreensis TaxID=245385 RepID=A0ABU1G585_9GAMM|nr:P-loop NTPase fold protein [Halomonas koreensis]MDR5868112.1 P-loop NTPase fold protein [Halomonas koreensis]
MELNSILWGDDSAEKDENLLSYFVDTDSYGRLFRKSKFLVVGRKGSGKSALRKKLANSFDQQKDVHVVNITPSYSSIRNIVNEESFSEGFGEEIFFQHSWLRQIMLDSLSLLGHKAKGKYTANSMEFARGVSVELNRTSKDLVENISDVLSRVKLKAGKLGDLGLQLEKELRAVAEVDALEHHLTSIAESGAEIVIMVDDLDLGWDNSEVSNNMLLGLLAASSYLMALSRNIHVFVYLREDVYSILMSKTQHSDKYRNVERIRWSKGSLINLMERRINFNIEQAGEEPSDRPFSKVFPETVGTHNTDNWLVERTLSRPRELIQMARFYTEGLQGDKPDSEVLKACEPTYSSWKLDDLCTEYSNQYPNLSTIFSFWKTKFFRNKYHLKRDEVDEMLFQVFSEAEVNQSWFNDIADQADFESFLHILYEIGFIGDFVQGGQGGSKTFFSYSDRHEPRFEEVQIHPCFRKSVNTVERMR